MIWRGLGFIVLFIGMVVIGGQAAAQMIEGLRGEAAGAIEAEIRKKDFGDPITAHIFYGDLTGTGTNDAIAFLYHPSGGNSFALTSWIWRDTESGYVLVREPSIEEVFGVEPRDVRFSAGKIEVTTTVLNPGDPRCCPTGQKTFTLSIQGTAEPASAADLDVPILEQAGDGQMANCMSSMVVGLRADGDGFLAVRAGPGTQHRKIDELHNGDVVIIFEIRGNWAGVVYRTSNVRCSSQVTRPVTHERKGWVHTRWLKAVAG